jgi:PD-(D/E)XK nuclease superfamily protein
MRRRRGKPPGRNQRPAQPLPTRQTPAEREQTTKRRGEISELAFALAAARQGFGISRPYGDSERYDIILDCPRNDPSHMKSVIPTEAERKQARHSVIPTEAQRKQARHSVIPTEAERKQARHSVIPTEAQRKQARHSVIPTEAQRKRARHSVIPTEAQRKQAKWRDLLFAAAPTRPRLIRVQVKATTQMQSGVYRVNAHRRIHGKAVPYKLSEIDFFAAYVIPEDSWFIFPLPHILGATAICLSPKRRRKPHPSTPYREAWHLLHQPDGLEFA